MLDNNHLPNVDLTAVAIGLEPNAPNLYNSDGTLNWQPNNFGSSTWDNPLGYLLRKFENKTTRLISSAVLSYRIIPDLVIRTSFGYNNIQGRDIRLNPLSGIKPEYRPYSQRYAVYGNKRISSWIVEHSAFLSESDWKRKPRFSFRFYSSTR